MRLSRAIIPIALCIMLLSFAAPAQKRKGRAAKPHKPATVVTAIDTEALKGLLTQATTRPFAR